jgi:heme A synthase
VDEATPERAEGWYPDPHDEFNYVRFWDGDEWTDLFGRTRRHPDRARARQIANLFGVSCLVVFLLATFLSSKVAGVSCGTWMSPETLYSTVGNALASAMANQECSDKLETRRLIALIALGVGLVARFGLPSLGRQRFDQ